MACLLLPMHAMAEVRDAESHFFNESFGNFAEELVNAMDEGKKAVLLMFQQEDCPYCQRMRTTVLNQQRVQDYYRDNFLIFHVDIEGGIEITDFNSYEKASAELTASRARLSYAQWQRDMASVAAPWDAWIVERKVEPGQMLVAEQRSAPLLVLAKTGVMTARAELPLSSVQTLATGQPARVQIEDRQYAAKVTSLGMRSQTGVKNGYYALEVEFKLRQDDVFRAGQAATIRLP